MREEEKEDKSDIKELLRLMTELMASRRSDQSKDQRTKAKGVDNSERVKGSKVKDCD